MNIDDVFKATHGDDAEGFDVPQPKAPTSISLIRKPAPLLQLACQNDALGAIAALAIARRA